MDVSTTQTIKRKPLPSAPPSPSPDIADILDGYYDDQKHGEVLVKKSKGKSSSVETRPSTAAPPNTVPPMTGVSILSLASPDNISNSSTTAPAETTSSSSKSVWKTAIDETIHFAGGLISHPFESTKHYSILRHSSGLVFYKGPTTNVTITIFADTPLPPDRSLWLQRKGFSGNLGMNASALLRNTASWIDVTPANEALSSEVSEQDERAWQRDMKKFSKKAATQRNFSKHVARETCIVRIPAAAEDGYLRIVMCTGEGKKKVLCPSPVFRIASTSSDVSVFRGASLSTMPLEAGLKAASVLGTTVINRYIGPARAVVENRVTKYTDKYTDKYKPGFVVKHAEHIGYAKTGLKNQAQSLEQHFAVIGDVSYDPLHAQHVFDEMGSPPEVVGNDCGPEQPFPIRLDGKVVQGTGQGQLQTGTPTANLAGVSSDLLLRLGGIYIGWASVQSKKGLEDVPHDWHEAIITVGPSPYAAPQIVLQNVATVHIIHDFGSSTFFDAKVKVVIMAFLRPLPRPDRSRSPKELADAVTRDVDIALASLSREHWAPEITVQRLKTAKSSRNLSVRYVDARTQVQKRVDSVPLHWAGVRSETALMKDINFGNGGLWIRR